MMKYEEVLSQAKEAIHKGTTRICLGAAWREIRDSKQFDEVLPMVKGITNLGVEVCCTLGMLNQAQAKRLKEMDFMPTTTILTRPNVSTILSLHLEHIKID